MIPHEWHCFFCQEQIDLFTTIISSDVVNRKMFDNTEFHANWEHLNTLNHHRTNRCRASKVTKLAYMSSRRLICEILYGEASKFGFVGGEFMQHHNWLEVLEDWNNRPSKEEWILGSGVFDV